MVAEKASTLNFHKIVPLFYCLFLFPTVFLPHPYFLFTSSQFVFEVCNINFLFLALTSEEIGLCFTLCAQYVRVALFLTVITAAESIYCMLIIFIYFSSLGFMLFFGYLLVSLL